MRLETSELCFEWKNLARCWKNRSEIVPESEKERIFVVAEREIIPRCSWQLPSKMEPYSLSTEQGTGAFLKYVLERGILENRRETIRSAGKKY